MTKHDSKGSEMYRMLSGPAPPPNAITVDLASLEELSARFDVPHFWQKDFEIFTKHEYSQKYLGWTVHMIVLAGGVMVVAYEKSGEGEILPIQDKEGVD